MQTSIQKWGNSLGIRIPAQLIQKLHLHEGDRVEIVSQDTHLCVYPKPHSLADLLAQVTDENSHSEHWGNEPQMGKEEW